MVELQDNLNEEQWAVVERGDGPCLVLAGAGSGKTRTITYRVAYLLANGVAPDAILLVTFTNKAAKEMMNRVEELTHGATRLPWSGTFHHIAYRLLRRYAPLLGYKPNFSILDSEDSVGLIKLCLKQEGIDRQERRFPSPSVLNNIISFARNAEQTIEEVLELKHPQWVELAPTIVRIMSEYQKRKRDANVMDFDDLLVNTYLLLLKSEAVKKKYSEQFRYVLVDEYQDTNTIQASIIRLFASHHRNVLVVGDDAQSIYSFRAANIKNILDFEKEYPDAKVFRLVTNYRSTPNILDVANVVIANNVNQYKKELKSVLDPFVKPEVRAFADQSEEAVFIADRILELRDEGVPLRHMAVLFRAAFHSQALELELTKRDIPYEYRGGVRFFERAHIKDVLSFLRIAHNVADTIAWNRVLNMQVGIGPAGADKIIREARETDGSVEALRHLGSLLSARGQVGWNDFLHMYESMDRVEEKTPSNLIEAVLGSKYAEYLENEYPDYRERLQDLEQLALFAKRQTDLHAFLGEASLQESFTASQARQTTTDDEEKIVLSTIHQAKGLEWEVVFILHMSAGQFPSDRALREDKGIEEERRLFYVAVTRAKKQLYFTYPLVGGFDTMLQGPSIFLGEIDRDLVEEEGLAMGNGYGKGSQTTSDDIIYVSEDEPFPSKKKPSSFLKDVDDL